MLIKYRKGNMVATLWLLPLLTITLITTSECVYAPPPLVKYRRVDSTPFGFQDDFLPEKRTKPSLSIVNPLDVLRQRLLLEIARRQMRENSKQVEINRAILKNVGKRSNADDRLNERERFEPYRQHPDINMILNRIVDDAAQTNDLSLYAPTSDYYFDDSNAIDTPIRFHPLPAALTPDDDKPDDTAWRDEKQQNVQPKQQQSSGQKSHLLRQWSQRLGDKTNPATPHKFKTFDNNDLQQSFDLN